MKRNYSLLRIAVLLIIGSAFLPGSAWGQDVVIVGTYNGFSQSRAGGRGVTSILTIDLATNIDWTGRFTLYGNTYAVRGKVDNNGNLEFNSGRAGPTKGTGEWQDLTRGGALIFGSYKLASGDQGTIILLRNFSPPPDTDMPPDIAGSWPGTFQNILSLMRGTVEWTVQQDRTPTGAPSTGFMGQETMDTSMNDFVGTIDRGGNFVRIGVSAQGFLIGAGKVESGQLTGTTVENYNTFHPTVHYTVQVGQ